MYCRVFYFWYCTINTPIVFKCKMIFGEASAEWHTGKIRPTSMNTPAPLLLQLYLLVVSITYVKFPAELFNLVFSATDNLFVLASRCPYYKQGLLLLVVASFVLLYYRYQSGTRVVKRNALYIVQFVCGSLTLYFLSRLLANLMCYMDPTNARMVVALH